MDWSWLNTVVNLVLGGAVGILGKVIYDRLFAKQPDLRYSLGAPATFGAGDRATIYQNLEVSNLGRETTTDVRLNFSLPAFDLVEHQISYDGPHTLERTEDRLAIGVSSLPPGDAIALSFTFSPSKSSIDGINDIFLSAKSKDCIAKPLDRLRTTGGEWIGLVLAFSVTLVGISVVATLVFTGLQSQVRVAERATTDVTEQLQLHEKLNRETKAVEVAKLTVQVANPVFVGREAEIQCHIENTSSDPFYGSIIIAPPFVLEGVPVYQSVNVQSKNRQSFTWKAKIPKQVAAGRYLLIIRLSGRAFDQPVELHAEETIDVRM